MNTQDLQELNLDQLELDRDLQPRDRLREAAVVHYADALLAGENLPPIDVFRIDGRLFVVDGFHRVAAHRRAGRPTIAARVFIGSRSDAWLFAVKRAGEHAIPLTNAEKAKVVARLLHDGELRQKSDRELARIARVSHTMVANHRHRMSVDAVPQAASNKQLSTSSADELDNSNADEAAGNTDDERERRRKPRPLIFCNLDEILLAIEAVDDAFNRVRELGVAWLDDPGPDVDPLIEQVAQVTFWLNDSRNLLVNRVLPEEPCASCDGTRPDCSSCLGKGWLCREDQQRVASTNETHKPLRANGAPIALLPAPRPQ